MPEGVARAVRHVVADDRNPRRERLEDDERLTLVRAREDEHVRLGPRLRRVRGVPLEVDGIRDPELAGERLELGALRTIAVDVQVRFGPLRSQRGERPDRMVDALARDERIEHEDPAGHGAGASPEACGSRVRHDERTDAAPHAPLDIPLLALGEPQHPVESVGDVEPALPRGIHRRIPGEGRQHMARVGGVEDPDAGVQRRLARCHQRLPDLARFADQHDGLVRGRRDAVDPGAVQPREAGQPAGHAVVVPYADGHIGQVPGRVSADDREAPARSGRPRRRWRDTAVGPRNRLRERRVAQP